VSLLQGTDDLHTLAGVYNNLGYVCTDLGQPSVALLALRHARALFEALECLQSRRGPIGHWPVVLLSSARRQRIVRCSASEHIFFRAGCPRRQLWSALGPR